MTTELFNASPFHGPHLSRRTRLLVRIIYTVTQERDIPLTTLGPLVIHRDDGSEVESGFCLSIGNQVKAHEREGFPNLIIEEEDWNSLQKDYASIGITEVWQFADGRLSMHRLNSNGDYMNANSSVLLPQLTIEKTSQFMRLSEDMGETEWLYEFQKWVIATFPG